MEEITSYTQRTPKALLDRVDEEAARERRSRTEQVNRILEERYGLIKSEEKQPDAA